MKPLAFAWPYAPLFWAAFLWAYSPEFRIIRNAQRSSRTSKDRSLQVILSGQSLAFLASFTLAWVPALQAGAASRPWMLWAGVALLVGGSLLRRHCWRMLGASFTGDVQAHADQEVVTRGAYALLRHPSYTAGILMNAGVGFALTSWISVLLLGGVSFAVYGYRMHVEERALLAAIGEPYARFMATRKRLIPFVY